MNWNDPNAKSRQEVRDEKEERDSQDYVEMCHKVKAERDAAGLPDSPIIVCAEAAKRLRAANP